MRSSCVLVQVVSFFPPKCFIAGLLLYPRGVLCALRREAFCRMLPASTTGRRVHGTRICVPVPDHGRCHHLSEEDKRKLRNVMQEDLPAWRTSYTTLHQTCPKGCLPFTARLGGQALPIRRGLFLRVSPRLAFVVRLTQQVHMRVYIILRWGLFLTVIEHLESLSRAGPAVSSCLDCIALIQYK